MLRIDLNGSFPLSISYARAFPLFTARGEMDWVPGWLPSFVYPETGELEEDQVFLTADGPHETIWSVVRLDRGAHAVEYLRVTPGQRLARVSVAVREEAGGCRVHVRYLCTALRPEAEDALRSFAEGYEAMLAEWEALIARHLERTG